MASSAPFYSLVGNVLMCPPSLCQVCFCVHWKGEPERRFKLSSFLLSIYKLHTWYFHVFSSLTHHDILCEIRGLIPVVKVWKLRDCFSGMVSGRPGGKILVPDLGSTLFTYATTQKTCSVLDTVSWTIVLTLVWQYLHKTQVEKASLFFLKFSWQEIVNWDAEWKGPWWL